MAFTVTEEQRALQDTLRRSFADLCTTAFLRSGARSNDARLWTQLGELGLFEYFGDPASSSAVDMALVAFEGGRALLPTAALHALVLGPYEASRSKAYGDLLAEFGASLESVCSGGARISSAIQVESNRLGFITDAGAAVFVALPQKSTAPLRVMKAPALDGLELHDCLDLTRASWATAFQEFRELPAEDLALEQLVFTAAELGGVASRVVELTRDYVMTRKQFGVAVGSFQAVQQQLADAYLKAESCWALAQFAAECIDRDRAQLRLAALSALRFATVHVPACVEAAIQLSGGIGFTWEYDLHLYLRRAQTLASLHSLGEDDRASILNHITV